jgi:hypothetical protein
MTVEIKRRQIEEKSLIPEHRLGRHVEHDPRSLNFAAEEATKIVSVIHAAHGLPLDQTRGSCTAEALVGALDSDPDFKGRAAALTQKDADSLYDQEIILEGGDPKRDDPGGTGLLVCKAAKQMGLIRSYQHAFGVQAALRALVLRPVITGIDWYSTFDHPDRRGLITLGGGAYIRGGHEVLVDEIDVPNQEIGCWNSWGPTWGWHGRFRMKWTLWGKLLSAEGDVTIPIV